MAAYFYARDMGRVFRISEGLEFGMVGVNTGIISTEVAPFGGVKESGIGREVPTSSAATCPPTGCFERTMAPHP